MGETKAIFVTGGASGIGLATARLFASHGWVVGIADVDNSALALAPIKHVLTYHMDVCDREAWRHTLNDFTGRTGRLDVLFNNAGIGVGGPLCDADFADLDRVVAINFGGVLNGARIGYDYLLRTAGSCLLNTASASAIYGSAGLATYSATKFAVRALTEALDGEWAAAGIRVRDIVPAFTETPLLDAAVRGSNHTIRDTAREAGLELTPVESVAEAAWRAVHGDAVHTYVGKTADRMRFAAKWMPGQLRKMMRRGALVRD